MITVNKQSLTSLLAGMLADPSLLDDIEIAGLSLDSRKIQSGFLFLSLAAKETQRLAYLEQAIQAGVAVVLYEQAQDLTSDEISALAKNNIAAYAVRDLADKACEIAARFYGHPSLALTVIAVTGTNGKTSVSQFIAQSIESLGLACGVVGTLGVGRVHALNSTGMTTPDPITLQGVLADFCQQNIKYAVIEASSHALAQGRLNSITIDVAVLTNLTRDHLDYHKTMDHYAAAKALLFNFASVKTAVINSADEFGQTIIASLSANDNIDVLTYNSQGSNASFYAEKSQTTQHGLQFELISDSGSASINSSLLGYFNIDNLLATIASLHAVNIPFSDIINGIKQCQAVDGRMESHGQQQQAQLVVDFAHTPDALTQALKSLRAHLPTNGQLWCVFGCGGDRDVGKRPEMGRNAEHYADRVVVTDDNPRSESPEAIVNNILAGISAPEKVYIEHDRKKAIAYAVSHAAADDIVLIAGKGHEQYQEISGVQQPFSDADVVIEMLAANDTQPHNVRVGA